MIKKKNTYYLQRWFICKEWGSKAWFTSESYKCITQCNAFLAIIIIIIIIIIMVKSLLQNLN